ncbi:unnamed protein product [Cyclocybe aegerita]|uniref:F-box domain-containing protein n=1 Tax=Cyclocybe aegerita TaxID=1973307 RepID=A0A8S0WCZ3_CYCAE|nr:unnamed protein product [Cyclocybe aegerita]
MARPQSSFRCALCHVDAPIQPIDVSGQSCGFSGGPPCPACSELKNVDDKIHDTVVILQKLLEKQNVLKDKRNQYHDRLTNHLPLELVVRMFGFAIKQLPFYGYKASMSFQHHQIHMWDSCGHTPWTLSTVCKTWKDIIWATPQLWTSVSINTAYIPTEYMTFAKEWLRRSGRLPINLTLYEGCWNDRNYIGEEASVVKALFDIVNASSPRWRSLAVSVSDRHLKYLSGDPGGISRLEDLHFEQYPGFRNEIRETSIFCPHSKPSPQRVFAERVHFKSIGIVWDHVTQVELSSCPPVDCLKVLCHAPQTTHLTLGYLDDDNPQVAAPTTEPLLYKQLQFLKIRSTCKTIGFLFDSLTLPSLRELYISGHLSQAAALVARSGCPVTHLHLEEQFTHQLDPEHHLLDLLEHLPSVTELVLEKPHLSDTFFDRLGPYGLIEGDPELLPGLRSLKISRCAVSFQWQSVARMFERDPEAPEVWPRRALRSLEVTELEDMRRGDYYGSERSDSWYVEQRRRRLESLQIPEEVVRSLLEIHENGVEMRITDDRRNDLLPLWY